MSWRSITTGKRILLSEEPRMNADDFQLTQEDLGETGQDNQDFQTTEIPGDDPANGQSNPSQPPGMGDSMGGDPGMQDPIGSGDPMGGGMGGSDPMMGEDPMPAEENETDRLKKLTLLEKYKELIELISQTDFSIECLQKMEEYRNSEELDYAKDMLDKLDRKIKDVIAYRFLNEDYKELLRIFYYMKYSLISITNLLANITKNDKDVQKQNKKRVKVNRNK